MQTHNSREINTWPTSSFEIIMHTTNFFFAGFWFHTLAWIVPGVTGLFLGIWMKLLKQWLEKYCFAWKRINKCLEPHDHLPSRRERDWCRKWQLTFPGKCSCRRRHPLRQLFDPFLAKCWSDFAKEAQEIKTNRNVTTTATNWPFLVDIGNSVV